MFCSCGEKIQVLNVSNGKVAKTISEVSQTCSVAQLYKIVYFFIGCHSVEYYLLKSIFYNLGK